MAEGEEGGPGISVKAFFLNTVRGKCPVYGIDDNRRLLATKLLHIT